MQLNKNKISSLLMLLFGLSGCGSSNFSAPPNSNPSIGNPTPTPSPSPVATLSPLPTSSPEASPSPSPTVTVSPSPTTSPSPSPSNSMSPSPSPSPSASPSPVINVMSVSIDGANCNPSIEYYDEPCVSITICSPNTTTCQTINDIILDTGSFGLRIFKSVITVPLIQETQNGNSVAECATFGSGADWGSVATASLILANEPAVQVPIQVIDNTFQGFSTSSKLKKLCNNGEVDSSPDQAGLNGILGVGPLAQDCGSDCDPTLGNDANLGMYYSCLNGTCSGTTVTLSQQVSNPIILLPNDNNGLSITLPSVPAGGELSLEGSLTLGIGTSSNNIPGSNVTTLKANSDAEFYTDYNNRLEASIFDTGTNSIDFYDASITQCSVNTGFYCPPTDTSFNAILLSSDDSSQTNVSFSLGDVDEFNYSNQVIGDIGVVGDQSLFIWGLPYFFGRTIYFGIENTSSSLGQGPNYSF
jgi:hypothetical protein